MGDDDKHHGSRHILTVIASIACALLAATVIEYLADPPALARQYVIQTKTNDFSRLAVMSEIEKLRPRLAENETAMLHFGGSSLYRNVDPDVLASALPGLDGKKFRHAILGSINQRMIDALDIVADPNFPALERAVVVVTWSGIRLLDKPARSVKGALEMDLAAWNAPTTQLAVKLCCAGGISNLVAAGTGEKQDVSASALARVMTQHARPREIAYMANREHEHALFHAFRALIGERAPVSYKRRVVVPDSELMERQEKVFIRDFTSPTFSTQLDFNISILRILYRLCKDRGWSLMLVELAQTRQSLSEKDVARGVESVRERLIEFTRRYRLGYAIAADPSELPDTLFSDHLHVLSGKAQVIATRIYADAIASAWRQ